MRNRIVKTNGCDYRDLMGNLVCKHYPAVIYLTGSPEKKETLSFTAACVVHERRITAFWYGIATLDIVETRL